MDLFIEDAIFQAKNNVFNRIKYDDGSDGLVKMNMRAKEIV